MWLVERAWKTSLMWRNVTITYGTPPSDSDMTQQTGVNGGFDVLRSVCVVIIQIPNRWTSETHTRPVILSAIVRCQGYTRSSNGHSRKPSCDPHIAFVQINDPCLNAITDHYAMSIRSETTYYVILIQTRGLTMANLSSWHSARLSNCIASLWRPKS
jgi:hypothetical protein